MKDGKHDSAVETKEHIFQVLKLLCQVKDELTRREVWHDRSKLESPEKEIFDEFTPKLSAVTYGSDEYKAMLEAMKPAISHHHSSNRHHPEFHKDGIAGMDLIDLIEMVADWKAATLRHNDGDLSRSIDINAKRFNIHPDIVSIIRNTAFNAGWFK